MVGNRSTGMRSRLVTPMTTSTRQMTIMKYGFRMEKRDIAAMLSFALRRRGSLPIPVHQQVSGGHDIHGQNDGSRQTADNRARERSILFASGSHFQRHRHHADNRG